MKNITYLFGAGASAGCLPVVDQIPNRLVAFKKFISENATEIPNPSSGLSKSELLNLFLDECEELIIKTLDHASIDTYAKKLRINIPIKGDSLLLKYNYVKVILSCFFIYEQMVNKPDKRYDAFFAANLNDSHYSLPKNVKILSWNYDFQFEKAYSEYCLQPELSNIQKTLRVFDALFNYEYEGGFGIFKLNGTTSFTEIGFPNRYWNVVENVDLIEPHNLVYQILEVMDLIRFNRHKYYSNVSFAWEADWTKPVDQFLNMVESAVSETEILVIIGYSFPFFNRSTDRRMLKSEKLKKVYIQDIHPGNIQSALRSVLPEDVTPEIELLKVSTDSKIKSQFFLPPEL